MVALEKEMNQFNDLLKMLIDVLQDQNQLVDEDEREQDDEWFDEKDTQACSFKKKVHRWLRETAQKTSSAKLPSRVSSSISDKVSGNSRVSKTSHRLRSSKNIKQSAKKDIEERLKLAELMTEVSFLQEKQTIQKEAAVMEIKEGLAKARTSARAYTNIALDGFHESEGINNKHYNGKKTRSSSTLKKRQT